MQLFFDRQTEKQSSTECSRVTPWKHCKSQPVSACSDWSATLLPQFLLYFSYSFLAGGTVCSVLAGLFCGALRLLNQNHTSLMDFFFLSCYQNKISSSHSEPRDPKVRGHHTIHWATQSLDHNVNKSPFIFVTAASVQSKTVPKITSAGITYWFVSYSTQSLFYSFSGRGQGRLKITPSVWGAGLRNSQSFCSSQEWGFKNLQYNQQEQ